MLLNPHVCRLHDLTSAYPDLHVDGLAYYPERALLLPGEVWAPSDALDSYLGYLRDVGIGAPANGTVHPIRSRHNSLVKGLTPHDYVVLGNLTNLGYRMEFFLPTGSARQLTNQLGVHYANTVWGPLPNLAALVNDKIWLRRFAQKNGLAVEFPEFVIVRTRDTAAVKQAVSTMLKFGGAVIKHGNLASGDGLHFITPQNWEEQVAAALEDLRSRRNNREIIVERAYLPHIPYSVQLELDDEGPHLLALTRQLVSNGAVHSGNVMSSGHLVGLAPELEDTLRIQAHTMGQALWQRGYRGNLGFDFLEGEGRMFLIEANGRITGATYPLAVGLQVAGTDPSQRPWAVATDNLNPGWVRGFDQFRKALGDLVFNGEDGVLLAAPSLTHHGKAMCYAVASTELRAEAMLAEAARLLVAA